MTLGWSGSEGAQYTLQTERNGSWVSLYEGTDTASTLTGLSNGDYVFRVRENDGEWSAPLTVTIKHHPLVRAWAFFISGFVLFIILCVLLIFRPFSGAPDRSAV